MKIWVSIIGLVSLLAPSFSAASAEESAEADAKGGLGEFSASVGLTSDYVWRGISQSDNAIALQGGLTWSHGSGFYLGTWGSTVDFNDSASGSLELDVFAGYKRSVGDFTYDFQALYFIYPGARADLHYDFTEGALGVRYDFGPLAVTGGFAYSPETFGKGGRTFYFAGSVSLPLRLPHKLTLNGSTGRYVFEDAGTAPDYMHYDIGASASLADFDIVVSYSDTDLSAGECGSDDACDGKVLLGISRSF